MTANFLSLVLLALLLWGRTLWSKNLRLHIAVMLSCFAGDLLLVFALVTMRNALAQVSPGMHWTLKLHVPIAVGTLVFYFLASLAGYRLYKGDERARPRLKLFDKILVTLRVLNLATSLMVTAFK
jgi:hypothetical protein